MSAEGVGWVGQDPETFWGRWAEQFHWETKFSSVGPSFNFDIKKGDVHIEWFHGGRTNLCYNCLDRNIAAGLGSKVAIFSECNDVDDNHGAFTYDQATALLLAIRRDSRVSCNVCKFSTLKSSRSLSYLFAFVPVSLASVLRCQVFSLVCRLANALKAAGVKRGDRVSVRAPPRPRKPRATVTTLRPRGKRELALAGLRQFL